MTTFKATVALATLGLALAGNASSASADSEECPTFVRGAKLSVDHTDDGVSLQITTSDRTNIAPLRRMLRELATIVERETRIVNADQIAPGDLPPVRIDVGDIAGGARVVVHAKRLIDIGLVRQQARGLELFWQSSSCINGDAVAAQAI